MQRFLSTLCFLICLMVSFVGQGHASALEQVTANGYIDWERMKIVAFGIGAPPLSSESPAQATAMSKRAAIRVAKENLLDVVKGVHIDSTTKVENFMVSNENVFASIKNILRDAIVEDLKFEEDGSVKAKVNMPLTGRLGNVLLSLGPDSYIRPTYSKHDPVLATKLQRMEKRIADLEAKLSIMEQRSKDQGELIATMIDSPKDKKKQSATKKKKEDLPNYTGIVLDARKLGFKPSLKPEIYGTDSMLYPGTYIKPAVAVKKGFVHYTRNLSKAQQKIYVGKTPLYIRPKGQYNGKSTLKLSIEDTNLLWSIIQLEKHFLQECSVVIVF